MQSVIHEYTNLSSVFTDMEFIYTDVSSSYTPGLRLLPLVFDTSFIDLYEILRDNVSWCPQYVFEEKVIPHINVPESNNMIVCISGGKDSVAVTKHYIDMGYNVYLYHMHGINKVYTDEIEAVKNVAKYFDIPLYVDTVVLSGTQDFVEHPMKNFIIANGAIHYAIREHLGINIAFGNFNESYLEDNDFDVCAGDCMDMWYAYEKIVRRYLPQFTMNIPFKTSQDTVEILIDNPELLELCISCMSPYRFRDYWKKRTEKKYGVQLMPHRCGCCWKCASEYIIYSDLGILDFDMPYYIHCLEILYHNKVKESKIKRWTIQDLWSEYFLYTIDKSRAYKEIKDAIISNGKVKCITQTSEG
jgi:hypothetical protein